MTPTNRSTRTAKKVLAYALLGLLLLLILLHLPPTKRLLRPVVSAGLSRAVGGPVDLGALDYSLWRGRLELQDLHVVPDRERLPFELSVQRAELRVSPLGRARVRLDAPDLTFFWQEGPERGPSRSFLARLNPITLLRLELADGTARVVRPSDDFSLEVRSISLDLGQAGYGHRAELRAEDATLQRDSSTLRFGPFEGVVETEGSNLRVVDARVARGDSLVEVNGAASSLDPLLGSFDVEFRADGELLRELVPETDLRGVVEGSALVEGDSGGTRVTAGFRSEELRWSDLEPWSLAAEASLVDDVLRLDNVNLTGYGGTLRAGAEIDLSQDRQSLRVDFDGLDLRRAGNDLGAPVPLASRAAGNLQLSTAGWELGAAEGEGRVELTPTERADPTSFVLPASGAIDLSLSDGAATVDTRNLSIPNGGLELHARIAPVGPDGSVDADYRLRLDDLGIVAGSIPELAGPSQTLGLRGGVVVQGRAHGPLSDIGWNGTLAGQDLRLLGQPYSLDAQIGVARNRVRIDALSLHDLSGTESAGNVLVEGEIPLVPEAGSWELRGEVDSLPLEPLAPILSRPLEGTLAGRFQVTGRASDPDWSAELRAADLPLPRTGELTLSVQKQGRDLLVESARLESPAGTLEANGSYTWSDDGRLVVNARGREIRVAELPLLRNSFGEVAGVIDSLELELRGPVRTPAGLLRFTVREPSFRGVAFPNLEAELTSDGEMAELRARLADGRTLLRGTAALATPYPIEASLDLSALPLERLLQSELLLGDPEVLLEARGELEVAFPLLDPSRMEYLARVEQLVGSYHGIGGGAGSPFSIQGDREAFQVDELDLIGNQTAIAIAGRVPLEPDQEFDLSLRGDARLELLAPVLEDADPRGRASADLHLRGALERPDLTGNVTIAEAESTISGVRMESVSANVELDADRVRLQSLAGRALDGEFRLEGVLPASSLQSSEATRLQFEATDIDLARFLVDEGQTTSSTTFKVTTTGSFETSSLSLDSVVGSGSVSRIEARMGELTLTNPEAAAWQLAEGRFQLSGLRLSEAETDVGVDLTATLTDDMTWEASLQGRLDNALANPFVAAEGIVMAGATALDVRARGTLEDLVLEGTGTFEEARVVVREPPLAFSNLRGNLQFEEQRITLRELTAEVGGGRVEGSGTIDLSGVVDLSLEAESVRLSYPEGLRSEQSGSFRLSGGPESYVLSGDLWVLQSLFNGELAMEAAGFESMPDLGLATGGESFPERLRLDLRVQTVEDLRIDNDTAELQAAGNLVLSGTLASPEIDGVITVREDGTFRMGRNNYRIVSGQMVLRGYPTEVPELDLTMRTTVSQVNIVMEASGSLDDLNTDLSAPEWYGEPLTQSDLASLLITGRTIQDVDQLDTISEEGREFVTEQAVSMLGATLAGFAETSLGQVLPFRSITIDPARIASEVDPNARFTLGVGVTEELTVTYSVALNNSRSRLWIVDYLLPKNVELRGTQLEDEITGGASQRLFFDFHEVPVSTGSDSRRRVDLIRLVVSPPELEETLQGAIRVETGDPYDYWRTVEDVQRLGSQLREQGYLGALVDVEAVPVEENLVDLVYIADPGTPVEISWRGDDPGNEIRESVAGAWDPRVPESLLLTELARLALRRLWQERYYQATIETALEDGTDGRRLAIFHLFRGPRSNGLDIIFQGNAALSDRELRSALPPESSPDLYELILASPERLRENVERFCATRGYLDAQVADLVQEAGAPGGRFRVVIPVEEGDASPVATLGLEGAVSIPPGTLLDQLEQRTGEPFRFSAYQQDRTTLSSLYRREGFVAVRVRGNLERTPEGLAVAYQIDEGPRTVVGNIRVSGNQATKTSIIRRELTFQEGDPLRLSELTESQKQLYDLGIFRSVDVRADPATEDETTRDVVVEVIETFDLNVSYGLRYSSEEDLQVQSQLGLPNAFGAGQYVGLTVRADRKESLVRATFHTPYLFSRFNLDTDIFVSRETEDSEFFLDRFWSVTFQQTRPLRDWLDLQWSYSFRRIHSEDKLADPDLPSLDTTIHKNILATSLISDLRDSLIRPTRGHFWSMTLEGAPEDLRNNVPYIKTFGQLITFVPLGQDLIWAASYRLGIANTLGEALDLLPDDRFRAGGIDSVRGFAQDSLGPKFPGSDEARGGKAIAVFNQELRFPIYRWFHGGGFFDAGNIYREPSDFDPLDLRYSAGVGLRVLLPFGLFRLDWARALDREPGEDASQFWFSFGHAF